jgi:hypothetical protein
MRSNDGVSEADRRTIRRWYLVVGIAYGVAILLCAGVEAGRRAIPQWGASIAQAADR